MSIHVRRGGTWTEITSGIERKSPTVAWEKVVSMWVRRSGSWVIGYEPIPYDAIVFTDGTTVPTAATLATAFNDYFPRGSNGANGDVGADTHSDAAASGGTTGTWNSGTAVACGDVGTGENPEAYDHSHTINSHTHGSTDHKPPYITVKPYTGSGNLPIGTILLFKGASASKPSGTSVWSAADGKFIRMSSSSSGGTTGGNSTHSHPTNTPSSSTASTQAMTGSPSMGYIHQDNHTHTYAHATNAANNAPVYSELLILRVDTAMWVVPANCVMFFTGSRVPPGWKICDGTSGTTNYQDALIKGKSAWTTGDDTKKGSDTHTDTSPAGTTSSTCPYDESLYIAGSGAYTYPWSSGGGCHTHSAPTHTHGTTNQSIPLSKKLLVCIKL